MFRKILVAHDGSDGARLALNCAVVLSRLTGGEVTTLWVRHTLQHFPKSAGENAAGGDAQHPFLQKIRSLVLWMEEACCRPISVESRDGHPAQQIVERARDGIFDLIVLGNRGFAGFWGRLRGHTAARVCEEADCSVLIARGPISLAAKSKILVGFDLSDCSRVALQKALSLAAKNRSEVHVVWICEHVNNSSVCDQELVKNEKRAAEFFHAFVEPELNKIALQNQEPFTARYCCGNAANMLVAAAESHRAALIVVGHRGQSGPRNGSLGGTANRVSHVAPCDVLIVKPAQE